MAVIDEEKPRLGMQRPAAPSIPGMTVTERPATASDMQRFGFRSGSAPTPIMPTPRAAPTAPSAAPVPASMPGVEVSERPATPSDMRQFARDPGPGNPRVGAAGSPEAQAFRGGMAPATAPAAPAAAAAPPKLGFGGRLASVAGNVLAKAGRITGPAGLTLGAVSEGAKVYDTAVAPSSTGLDVAEQASEGVGRMAAATAGGMAGAKAGAALGALGGPAAPITVPLGALVGGAAGGVGGFWAAGKAAELGRSAVGSDPRSALERVSAPAALPDVPTSQAPTSTAMPSTGAGAGRGSAADPNRTDVDATNLGFGRARDFSRELAAVPKDLPSDMRDGVILKTKDANGRTVYSGRNVGADAQMVDGMGRGFQGRGTVSTVPGMAPGEARAILDRPFDPRNAMNPAQRAQYDSEVASAQAINRATAEQGGGRGVTVGDLVRIGMQRRRGALEKQESDIRTNDAQVGLGMRRQALAEADSAVNREQAQLGMQSTRQLQELQAEYLNADTDAKRNAAAKKIQALSGKSETPNRFTVIPGGSSIDPASGLAVQRPGMVLDNSTGRLVDLGAQGQPAAGQAQAYPEGTRLTGPGGKTYVVRDGKPVEE